MMHKMFQEMFDKGYLGLAKQGFKQSVERSVHSFEYGVEVTSHCAYRGDEGFRCFVGHLIPDDKYEPLLEGSTVRSPRVCDAIGVNFLDQDTIRFLERCQCAHDNEFDPEGMKQAFADIAKEYDLVVPEFPA